jgi:hypothetical protein
MAMHTDATRNNAPGRRAQGGRGWQQPTTNNQKPQKPKGPAARSEGPEAAMLAAVRPLGSVRSWAGLDVVRGAQLGPWAAGFGGR